MNLTLYKCFIEQRSIRDTGEESNDERYDNTQEEQGGTREEQADTQEKQADTQEKQDDTSSNITSASASTLAPAPAFNDQTSFSKISEIFNNNGQVNFSPSNVSFVNNNLLGKRRELDNIDSPNLTDTEHIIPTQGSLSVSTNNLSGSCELKVTEGTNQYHLTTPSAQSEIPHKPKLRKTHLEALKRLFHFGTSFSSNDPLAASEYQACINEQKANKSLRSLNLIDCVIFLLDDVPFDTFNQTLWTFKPDDILTSQSKAFLEIIKHSLCSFHLVYRTVPEFVQNHERTHFVENIIPSLLALAKITGFVEFKWCETAFLSSSSLNLKDCDYDLRSAPPNKFMDALGILKTQNNMELVIVEASSGTLKENTTHTIEDSLKILECSVSALRKEAAHYKNASLKTFKKLKVYSLHVIKTQVTLSEMSLFDKTYWKFTEKRSAKLPTNWNDRLCFVQYLELLATLFDGMLTTQQIQKQLVKENIGLVEFSGPSVESICQEANFF